MIAPMLAEAMKGWEKALDKLGKGDVYAEVKYDGERVQIHKQGRCVGVCSCAVACGVGLQGVLCRESFAGGPLQGVRLCRRCWQEAGCTDLPPVALRFIYAPAPAAAAAAAAAAAPAAAAAAAPAAAAAMPCHACVRSHAFWCVHPCACECLHAFRIPRLNRWMARCSMSCTCVHLSV